MRRVERALAAYLRDHYWVISRADVLRLGGTDALIRAKLASGAWVRPHKNVYLLAAMPASPEQDLQAALAAVPGAVASHLSAAWLLGLVSDAPMGPHLTVATRPPRLAGVEVHHAAVAPPVVRVRGFPCTTASRTLVDVAAIVGPELLTAALDQALALRHTAVPRLYQALRTTETGRRGAKALRLLLDARGLGATPEPSVLESRMDRLLRRSGLPLASAQHSVAEGRYRLDYAWPTIRLAVEVKGYAWHSSPESLQADAARERHLAHIGWTMLCFTWADVTRRPDQVVAEIVAAHERLTAERHRQPG